MRGYDPSFCPRYHFAVELIGRRWTGVILRALLQGKSRYSEIRATVPDISDRMLSERLGELEREGIVERRVVEEKPVRVEYVLTEKGQALQAAVAALSEWAETWIEPQEAPASAENASPS